jgi:hypothetical protein
MGDLTSSNVEVLFCAQTDFQRYDFNCQPIFFAGDELMSKANFLALSGIAAMLAGLLRAVATFVPETVPVMALQTLYMCTDIFILLAVIGLYDLERDRIGGLGLAGFLSSLVGLLVIRSANAFTEINLYALGAVLLLLGLIALSNALRRVGALPSWIIVLWTLSFAAGVAASVVPRSAVPTMLAGLLFSVGIFAAGRELRLVAARRRSE